MNTTEIKVYVPLLEEGHPTVRGTQAITLGNGHYRLLPTPNYNPEDEVWEFLPGSIVRCEKRVLQGKEYLVAIAKA
jgi:hypothetical protein